jgi:hypothetical protein
MGDSDGVFGGNGSVYFRVRLENPKQPPTLLKFRKSGYTVEGHDGTPERSDFKVVITVNDANRDAVARSLTEAATEIGRTGQGKFIVPVEPGRNRQIDIRWQSAREPFVAKPNTRGERLGGTIARGTRKRGAAKGSSKRRK